MLIHVGLPRTGSTTLQDDVFNRASRVYYLGRIRGSKSLDPTSRSAHAVDTILNATDDDFEDALPGIHASLAKHLEVASASDKMPGGSTIKIPSDVQEWIMEVSGPQNLVIEAAKELDLRSLGYLVKRHDTDVAA